LLEDGIAIVQLRRAVQKESSDFDYLENQSRGLDVTRQPARGDVTAHP